MDGDGGPRRDDAPHRVVPGSARPCGCHVRLPDYRDVLCAEHAARRAERRAAERRRAEQRARVAEERLPWAGRGGRAFRWALLTALLTVVATATWTDAAAEREVFDEGFVTTTATVDHHTARLRGPDSYGVSFVVAGKTHRAVLEDVVGRDLDVGGTVQVDHAVTDPAVVRTSGYDSAGDAAAAGGASAALAAVTALLLGRWVVARRRSR